MQWWRLHRRFGGCLALFALAVQLALTSTHIHHADNVGAGPKWIASLITPQPSASDEPWHTDGVQHHACAICISIGLLGGSLDAERPVLPLPVNFAPLPARAAAEPKLPFARYFSFQTRAPPTV